MLERTFLFGLALVGAGTAQVESLRSWVLRLAFAHCVKPRKLFEMLLERFPLDGPNIDISELLKTWNIHGSGQLAMKVRSRLERATGSDLLAGTLTPLSHLMAEQHLVKPGSGRYCPECVKEDHAHGHLLWEVACVKACPTHGVRLRDASACGAPIHEHLRLNTRPQLSHVCSRCGSVGFGCVTEAAEPATDDEVWVATQVGRLLSCGAGVQASWSNERLRLGLHMLVEGWYDHSVVKASLSAGLCRASVCTWVAGTHKPSFAGLMQLCHHAQVDIVGLLGGHCELAPSYENTAELQDLPSECDADAVGPAMGERAGTASRKHVVLYERSYVRRSCSLEDIRLALVGAIAEMPPPNLTQLAQGLQTNPRFVMLKWPALAKELIDASARHQQELNAAKFAKAASAYEHAARSLVENGKPVTPKYLQKVSGLVVFGQNETRVRAMESVLRKFGGRH